MIIGTLKNWLGALIEFLGNAFNRILGVGQLILDFGEKGIKSVLGVLVPTVGYLIFTFVSFVLNKVQQVIVSASDVNSAVASIDDLAVIESVGHSSWEVGINFILECLNLQAFGIAIVALIAFYSIMISMYAVKFVARLLF